MRSWFRVVLFCALATTFLFSEASAQIRTVVVSPVPGNPSASGTALLSAVAGISSPSSTDPWLVKLEPGIYDVGATPLQMRSWIDIEGSGIGVTTIRGTVDPDLIGYHTRGTINGASNAELRMLKVEANGTASIPGVIAMANVQASPRIYRVRFVTRAVDVGLGIRNSGGAALLEECEIVVSLTTSGPVYGIVYNNQTTGSSVIRRTKIAVTGTDAYGIFIVDPLAAVIREIWNSEIGASGGNNVYGVFNTAFGGGPSQSLVLRSVELVAGNASVSATGIDVDSGVLNINIFDSRVYGILAPTTYGIRSELSSTVEVRNSEVVGATNTATTAGSMSITTSGLRGGPAAAGGWLGCAGVWDEANTFFPGPVCP